MYIYNYMYLYMSKNSVFFILHKILHIYNIYITIQFLFILFRTGLFFSEKTLGKNGLRVNLFFSLFTFISMLSMYDILENNVQYIILHYSLNTHT